MHFFEKIEAVRYCEHSAFSIQRGKSGLLLGSRLAKC